MRVVFVCCEVVGEVPSMGFGNSIPCRPTKGSRWKRPSCATRRLGSINTRTFVGKDLELTRAETTSRNGRSYQREMAGHLNKLCVVLVNRSLRKEE